ncbi:hypothetical protein RhiirC2_801628 [Rhizophagus irregularis]|uniref:Uncharacterized protein n=1 Tax=Rhizophagus irregularis TaxID=588596 RepID=A0A2N1M266_9GLOM|nr:hypothetical protein RhiirC2_801628 [Rhizophagus irregularis]
MSKEDNTTMNLKIIAFFPKNSSVSKWIPDFASGDVNNTKKKFIGCTKWKPKEKNHQFLTIPPNVDLELLEMMFNEHSYHPHRTPKYT